MKIQELSDQLNLKQEKIRRLSAANAVLEEEKRILEEKQAALLPDQLAAVQAAWKDGYDAAVEEWGIQVGM